MRPLLILKVYRINHRFNVLYVNGCVPGHTNTYVRITDAIRRPHKTPPPFPTFFSDCTDHALLFEETYAESIHQLHEPTITFPNLTIAKK